MGVHQVQCGAGATHGAVQRHVEHDRPLVVGHLVQLGGSTQAGVVHQHVDAAELGVTGIACDVTDESSVQNLFATAARELGGVDVLVNNAGLGGTAELHEMTDDQWSIVLDVTLNGTMRCTRAA
ncbi:MAG: SDR family NAD(P)-dependent oxidoreductase, partial [Acidimicrobiia bacterium]|nr:SDR family NAD(P)-dependent oxidoreductase [Acidimicrobiia bacterium]